MTDGKPILIIGTLPPPLGGVTVHCQRLINRLSSSGVKFVFVGLNIGAVRVLFKSIHYETIHLHTSSSWFRLLFAIFCFILRKKLIQTYHGDIGRFKPFRNYLDMYSIKLTKIPVVINRKSFELSLGYNKSTRFISPFIIPNEEVLLEENIAVRVDEFSKQYQVVFSTNASCLKYDKNGEEVYQVTRLVEIFRNNANKGLVFSDPTGEYYRFFRDNDISTPQNVLIISSLHSFTEIIKRTSVLIRATTTDGDSISIKEALYFGKSVIASDCVDRPIECILYRTGSNEQLSEIIASIADIDQEKKSYEEFDKLLGLYGASS